MQYCQKEVEKKIVSHINESVAELSVLRSRYQFQVDSFARLKTNGGDNPTRFIEQRLAGMSDTISQLDKEIQDKETFMGALRSPHHPRYAVELEKIHKEIDRVETTQKKQFEKKKLKNQNKIEANKEAKIARKTAHDEKYKAQAEVWERLEKEKAAKRGGGKRNRKKGGDGGRKGPHPHHQQQSRRPVRNRPVDEKKSEEKAPVSVGTKWKKVTSKSGK